MAKSVTLSDEAYKILLEEKDKRGDKYFSETVIALTDDFFAKGKKR